MEVKRGFGILPNGKSIEYLRSKCSMGDFSRYFTKEQKYDILTKVKYQNEREAIEYGRIFIK